MGYSAIIFFCHSCSQVFFETFASVQVEMRNVPTVKNKSVFIVSLSIGSNNTRLVIFAITRLKRAPAK